MSKASLWVQHAKAMQEKLKVHLLCADLNGVGCQERSRIMAGWVRCARSSGSLPTSCMWNLITNALFCTNTKYLLHILVTAHRTCPTSIDMTKRSPQQSRRLLPSQEGCCGLWVVAAASAAVSDQAQQVCRAAALHASAGASLEPLSAARKCA